MSNMRLTILGSGTMMPTKRRYSSSYLLEYSSTKILLDCGHCTIARLVELGINLHDIAIVAITHFHTDHFSDCFPLVHARWVDDAQSSPPRQHKPLTIIGPKTIRRRYQKWREIFWPEPKEDYPIKFIEGSNLLSELVENSGRIKLLDHPNIGPDRSNNIIRTFPVQHVPWFQSIGYRINDTFAYTGDCGSRQPPKFYEGIRGVQSLLIEAGTLIPTPNHFTTEQAAELVKKYHIRRVILTHIREHNLPAVQKIADQHSKPLTIAEDLKVYEI